MQKNQHFIFSEEFDRGMDEAVARAIARADALGLPKAYLGSYDDLLPSVKSAEVSALSGSTKVQPHSEMMVLPFFGSKSEDM